MPKKTLSALIAGSFLLLGCAQSGHYPLTGNAVGIDDQVKFMSAPSGIVRY